MSTQRVRGQGNHLKKKKTTNNPKDPKAPAPASNKPELTPKMAAKDTLQAPEPLSWFSAEMQKFVATIQISITIQLHHVDTTLEKMSEAIHLTNTKVTVLEAKCSDYKATAVDLRQGLIEKEVMELKDKLDDCENRQCC